MIGALIALAVVVMLVLVVGYAASFKRRHPGIAESPNDAAQEDMLFRQQIRYMRDGPS